MTSPADKGNGVPLRSLSARHRPRILAHLLALGPDDRYLRFGYCATDEQICKYVDMLDFDGDGVFGIFNRRLDIIAMAHLAKVPGAGNQPPTEAEFGVSVARSARGRGYGTRLFEHAMIQARAHGIHTLLIDALSENMPMLNIARNAGAVMVRDGSEMGARLRLPPDTPEMMRQALAHSHAAHERAAERAQARRVQQLLDELTDVGVDLDDNDEEVHKRSLT
jgi:GNAT superfamily N-acetyltransferase